MPVGTLRIVRYIVGVRYSGVSVKRGSTVYKDQLPYKELSEHTRNCITVHESTREEKNITL